MLKQFKNDHVFLYSRIQNLKLFPLWKKNYIQNFKIQDKIYEIGVALIESLTHRSSASASVLTPTASFPKTIPHSNKKSPPQDPRDLWSTVWTSLIYSAYSGWILGDCSKRQKFLECLPCISHIKQVLFNLLTNALMNSNIIFDKLELEKGKQLTRDHTVTELRRERRFVWSLKCLSFVLWLHVAFRDKTELVKSIRKQPETHCLWALRGNIKIPEEGRITCQHLPPHYHISLSPKSLPNTKSHPPSGLRGTEMLCGSLGDEENLVHWLVVYLGVIPYIKIWMGFFFPELLREWVKEETTQFWTTWMNSQTGRLLVWVSHSSIFPDSQQILRKDTLCSRHTPRTENKVKKSTKFVPS